MALMGNFDYESLLSNPLLHAGVALLGSQRDQNAAPAALQGLMTGQEMRQQQQSRQRTQDALNQAAAGVEDPAIRALIGAPETAQYGFGMLNRGGSSNLPASLQELEALKTMTPEEQDQFWRVKRGQETIDVGGVPHAFVPGSGWQAIRPVEDVAGSKATIAGATTTAQEEAKTEAERKASKPKAEAKLRTAKQSAANVLDAIATAKQETGPMTTGLLGSMTRGIPGSPAYDLTRTVETVKANLGFDRLQQMRDESPTGGALGQVAIQELTALQSTVSNLDTGQSPSQMMSALEKIDRHYRNYLNALEQSYQEQYGAGNGGADIQSLVDKYAD